MKKQSEQDKIFNATSSFKIQKYFRNEPEFNGFYFKNDLPKIKDGTYVINLDECRSIATHWIALFVNNGDNGSASCDATYFDSFGVEHISKDIKKFIGRKNSTTNIYRI